MAKHKSSQEWQELLSAYETWEGSQALFCDEYGISIASFHYHRRKQFSTPKAPAVIELPRSESINLEPFTEISQANCKIECHYPGVGLMQVHCQADQLAIVVDQLSKDSK